VHSQALSNYAQFSAAAAPAGSSASTEYDVIARITKDLRTTARDRRRFPDLVKAVHENLRLWTFFAMEVADASSPLSPDLRARLMYLAEFTRQHSSKVLFAQDTVDPLIDVNMSVLRGLRGAGE